VSQNGTLVVSTAVPRPVRRAFAWLAFLAPFFYLSYGVANSIAAHRQHVPSIVFAWERHIPFLDWTILPYWSINAFYALSFFVCATRRELDAHGRRLITAQIAAVVCFILFPLKFTFQQPDTYGLAGALFAALTSFDKPFNQAPSLHIALLVILWPLYGKHLPRRAQWPLHIWSALVGVSVLTTYQHHFFDIPSGVALGVLCMWMWPERRQSPLATAALTTDRRRLVLVTRYLIGGGVIGLLAVLIGGAGLWLLWPAMSLVLVAANYALFGPEGFQKDTDGRMSLAARLLLAPYLAAAFVNSRSWTRHNRKPVAIGGGVWLGRIPFAREVAGFATVVDLCAELPGGAAPATWTCIPMLDLVPPSPTQLRSAAASIERGRSPGPVLVCCALGYSRSAATVATWLLTSDPRSTMSEAIDRIRGVRPRIVIDSALRNAIAAAAERQS
jgi:membrane-associated phospholipid phosphatase